MALRPLRIEPLDLEQVRKRRVLGQSDLLQHGHGFQDQELKSENLPRIVGEGTEAEELEAKETPTFRVSTIGEPRRDFQQLLERINEAYKPETQDTERFRGLLDQFPQREEPSWRRKLVAGGLGLDARQRVGTQGQELTARDNPVPTMEAAMYAPHLRNLSDWKEKAQPFYNAANLERQSNIQERTLVSDALKAEQQERKNEIAARRAEAYWLKANQFKITEEGDEVWATNPNTLERRYLGKSGDMDRRELENLKGEWNVKAAEARGEAERGNIRARAGSKLYRDTQNNYFTFVPGEGWMPVGDGPDLPIGNTFEVGPAPRSGGASDEPNTAAEVEIARQNRMNAVAKQRDHRKWFTEDPKTGKLTMKPRPTKTGYPSYDEDRAHWDRVKRMVEPGYEIPLESEWQGGPAVTSPAQNQNPPGTPPPPTNVLQPRPPAQNGRTMLQDPNGKRFTLPAAQVDAFLRSPQGQGYSVVR